jgi:RNA polymerase sigma-70 factor (ECF subfamily)
MNVVRPDEASAESMEELFMALESPLLSYAARLLGHTDRAEDVVQEAFLRLHAQFDRVCEPRNWLYRTVHNLALNQQRQSRRTQSLDCTPGESDPGPREPADPQPLPDEQIARWEGIGQVRLCLQTLDARSRQLLQLKFNEGLSYREIGARTGLTIGHVGYLLHHALKALAAELAKTGILP